ILEQLREKECLSFEIGAMERWYCPNTRTPHRGGLTFQQATYLVDRLAISKKKIIGMDLVEVAPGEDDWDGHGCARLLFNHCGTFAKNNGLDVGDPLKF